MSEHLDELPFEIFRVYSVLRAVTPRGNRLSLSGRLLPRVNDQGEGTFSARVPIAQSAVAAPISHAMKAHSRVQGRSSPLFGCCTLFGLWLRQWPLQSPASSCDFPHVKRQRTRHKGKRAFEVMPSGCL